MLDFLEANWKQPDEGIWEVRGPRRHFTHSKVMAWVAFDRAVKDVSALRRSKAPSSAGGRCVMRFTRRSAKRASMRKRNTFVQAYGSPHLDASLLLIPQVGFLPPDDPRVRGTIEAIERDLVVDGLVLRYSTATDVDASARRAKAHSCRVRSGLPMRSY